MASRRHYGGDITITVEVGAGGDMGEGYSQVFMHIPFPVVELDSRVLISDLPDFKAGRWYKTSRGLLPSVTTRLKWHYGEDWKDDWIARVGQAEADQRTAQGLHRGSQVHLLAEKYVNNDPRWDEDAHPMFLALFKRVRPHLDEHLSAVYGIEYPLWSETLRTAGRADLIGRYKGLDTVLDYKTSRYARDVKLIESYFIQATVYALMTTERTGLKIPRIVIFLIPEYDNSVIVHEAWTCEWEEKAKLIFHKDGQ